VPGGQDLVQLRRAGGAVFQCLPGGGPVVLVDQRGIPGGGVDPDGRDEQQVLGFFRADHAVGDRVRDAAGHARLGRAPGEVAVPLVGHGRLVHEQGHRFDRQVRPQDRDEGRVSRPRHGQRRGPGRADRPVAAAEHRVDVRRLGALPNEALAD
jgi:hypothetical protein